MPNTPNLGLPYPLLSNTADVPRDMKALADRLDGLLQFGTDSENPMQVLMDPPADWGDWENFVTQSQDAVGGFAYSGPSKATDWDSAPVMNPTTRWSFTAPADGILLVNTFINFGHNSGIPADKQPWQEIRQVVQAVSGSVLNPYPQYVRHRHNGAGPTEYIDMTYTLDTWHILRQGAVASPYLQWRGKTYRAGTSDYRPRWSGSRMQALFIPGAIKSMNVVDNNSSAKMAVQGSTTDLVWD